jgi:hypothetical protein
MFAYFHKKCYNVQMAEHDFLRQYRVQDKPEAKAAAQRKDAREGSSGVFDNISQRIGSYLERLQDIFLHPDPVIRSRRVAFSKKQSLYPSFIIDDNPQNFPESYFANKIASKKELGEHDFSFTEEERREEIRKVIEIQKISLDGWINYLSGNDCHYPDDIKYFVMQGVLQLGKLDTEKYSFGKRGARSIMPFTPIDREALSVVMGALDAFHHQKDTLSSYPQNLREIIQKGGRFGDMYALVMRDLDTKTKNKEDLLFITDGAWRTFEQGSDPQILVNSLADKRSNLCIADIGSATSELEKGTVHIYFSNDHAGVPTNPRIAMTVSDGEVTEVRGTYNTSEDFDPNILGTDKLQKRMEGFSNGASYLAKEKAMKKLTEIYNKSFCIDKKTGAKTPFHAALSEDDMRFLYEIDAQIEGFGYDRDPRIQEIIEQRDIKTDVSKTLGIPKEKITTTIDKALKGGSLFHYGNLDLESLTSVENLILPEIVTGYLSLDGVTNAKGLTLPRIVGKGLSMEGLTSIEELVLPQKVELLNFGKLSVIDGVIFPQCYQIHLASLTSAKKMTFSEGFNGSIFMPHLTSTEGLVLPKVAWHLNLDGLTSAEGLVLPEKMHGDLQLNSLTSAEGLVLPQFIGKEQTLELKKLDAQEKDALRIRYPGIKII